MSESAKTLTIAVPSGIGDAGWAMTKIPAMLSAHGAASARLVVADNEPRRSKEFLLAFDFVSSVEYRKILFTHGIHPNGRYHYEPTGPNKFGCDFWLIPNEHLEAGLPLEDWLPQYLIDWDIARRFRTKPEDAAYARELAVRLGRFVVFYMGPLAGNTIAGHNRGPLWRPEQWIELGARIAEQGCQVVVVGAEYDRSYSCQTITAARKAGQRHWRDYVGLWSIGRTFAVSKEAAACISYQSGIGIFNAYQHVPTACWWRPYGDPIVPDRFITFDERMKDCWVPPTARPRYLGMLYGHETVDDIARWAERWITQNEPITVYTFPRSGTHWFCSLVQRRFYVRQSWDHAMQPSDGVPFLGLAGDDRCQWDPLFGGHWYDPGTASNLRRAVYLVRDGRDALVSLWELARRQGQDISLSDFIRAPVAINEINGSPPSLSRAELWHWSTARWMAAGVPVVRYEDLIENPTKELDRIAAEFGLLDDADPQDIDPQRPVGYNPGPARPGRWRELWGADDLEYFERCRDAVSRECEPVPVKIGAERSAGGPGTELMALLHGLGIEPPPDCPCHEHAEQMDRWGVDRCRANRETIIGWLNEARAEWGWGAFILPGVRTLVSGLAFQLSIRDPVGSLVDEAIERAERKAGAAQ